jgi:hypothetical protein
MSRHDAVSPLRRFNHKEHKVHKVKKTNATLPDEASLQFCALCALCGEYSESELGLVATGPYFVTFVPSVVKFPFYSTPYNRAQLSQRIFFLALAGISIAMK